MENKTGTLVSGLSGAAILALFMAPGATNSGSSKPGTALGSPSTLSSTAPAGPVSHSDAGPWTAVCGDYETRFTPTKANPGDGTGATVRALPAGADPDAIEVVKKFPDKKTNGTISEKYEVRSYPEGDLTTCLQGEDYSKMQVLLATIPDPIGSHFAMYFDRDIEALEAAAALKEFSLSRFWLPWDSSERPNPATAGAAKLAQWKERLDQPGVLVFHKGSGERLFVFLAAETPTSGIQRPQFGRALGYMQQILSRQPSSNQPEVLRIAGPHFSASLLGMAELLSTNTDCSTSLHILSPNATSDQLIANFNDKLSPDWPHLPCDQTKPHKWGSGSWFIPLSPSSNDEQFAAYRYLAKLGYCKQEVADLKEDESAKSIQLPDTEKFFEIRDSDDKDQTTKFFGTDDSADKDRNTKLYGTDDLGASKSKKKTDPFDDQHLPYLLGGCPKLNTLKPLRLSFSRDLSSLRNKTDSLVPSNSEINGVKLPLWSIPVTLGEATHEIEDSPRIFAVDQEAGRIDHDLQAIVASLRQHKIRALVMDASNDLDTLFLLEYFLRALPNMRFVILNADHLAIGRSQNVELTGTVAITGLPLLRDLTASFSSSSEGKETHVFFESSDTEGTYLATAMLMQGTEFNPSNDEHMRECAPNSVAGRSEFLLIDTPSKDSVFPCVSETHNRNSVWVKPGLGRGAPRSWVLILFATLIAVSLHLIYLFRSNPLRRYHVNGSKWTKLLCPPKTFSRFAYPGPCGTYEGKRLGMLLALNSQYLLLSLAVLTIGYFIDFRIQYDLLALICQLTDLAISVICIMITFLLIRDGLQVNYRKDFRLPLIFTSIYTVCTIAMGWHVLWRAPGEFGHEFNFLRIALIPEGISPFVPFLAITVAYIVYCRVELNSVGWAARRRVELRIDPKTQKDLWRLHDNLRLRLTPFSSAAIPSLVVATVIVCGVCIAYRLRNSFFGFDGPYFREWLVIPGFGGCLILVIFTVLRAWSVWRHLHRLLCWLHGTKLKPAFKQLHERDLPKLRIWDLGRRDQDLTIQTLTLESMEALVGEANAKITRSALAIMRTAQIEDRQRTANVACKLMECLNDPMERALDFLHRESGQWDSIGMEKQRYLALRFVAIIRYALLNIRNMYTFVVYGFAMLVVCVATYPFEGKSSLSSLLTAVFFFILLSIGMMFYQIQKDTVLSLIENSTPGEVKYTELIPHLISIGGVPALIVLATQFPSIAEVILTWAKPGLDLMK